METSLSFCFDIAVLTTDAQQARRLHSVIGLLSEQAVASTAWLFDGASVNLSAILRSSVPSTWTIEAQVNAPHDLAARKILQSLQAFLRVSVQDVPIELGQLHQSRSDGPFCPFDVPNMDPAQLRAAA